MAGRDGKGGPGGEVHALRDRVVLVERQIELRRPDRHRRAAWRCAGRQGKFQLDTPCVQCPEHHLQVRRQPRHVDNTVRARVGHAQKPWRRRRPAANLRCTKLRKQADFAVGQAADVCQVLAAAWRRARVGAGERHAESNVWDVGAQAGVLAGNRRGRPARAVAPRRAQEPPQPAAFLRAVPPRAAVVPRGLDGAQAARGHGRRALGPLGGALGRAARAGHGRQRCERAVGADRAWQLVCGGRAGAVGAGGARERRPRGLRAEVAARARGGRRGPDGAEAARGAVGARQQAGGAAEGAGEADLRRGGPDGAGEAGGARQLRRRAFGAVVAPGAQADAPVLTEVAGGTADDASLIVQHGALTIHQLWNFAECSA